MLEDTYGHTPTQKAFDRMDVYGVGYDEERASRPRIRLGVIGVGGVAQSKYFPAVSRLRLIWEPVEIVAFAEPREREARKVESIFGGHWYGDYHKMLSEEDIQGVLVLSPDNLHAEHTLACLEAGLHVLVEKPISRSLADAEAMCLLAERRGMALMTVATKRFSPPFRRAKKLIDDGPVRGPALCVGKFNLGYDYVDLFESGTIHLFDLIRYLMGDVRTVHAVGINKFNQSRSGYPIDNAVITLELASGAIAALYSGSSALSLKPWMRVEVYGNHAWLAIEDDYELILYEDEQGPAKTWKPVMTNTLLFDEEFGGFMGIVENFLQVIRGVEKPLTTGWDGYRAYELSVASHLSMCQRHPVQLPLAPKEADGALHDWFMKSGWKGIANQDSNRS